MTSVAAPLRRSNRVPQVTELVVCSLEPWDEVWRRNQFFVDGLLRRHPDLRVLFVEPPADPLFDVLQARWPRLRQRSTIRDDHRLQTFRPLKPLPRRLGSLSDTLLQRELLAAVRRVGFVRPVLWVNDVTYAPLIQRTGWPSVYDVTDDWLLAPVAPRELERLRALDGLALAAADEVTVCSPALAASRGATRSVTLIANGVDVDHYRRPRPRPRDLPPVPTAVYLGTLHEARLDLDLVLELARSERALSVVLVGPVSLSRASLRKLESEPNVHLLGARAYADVPAYLQHADVVIVPHRVTPFTESLDPIKAHEALAAGRPTVATPVAGFRDLPPPIQVAERADFVERVRRVLAEPALAVEPASLLTWEQRVDAFEVVLERAQTRAPQ